MQVLPSNFDDYFQVPVYMPGADHFSPIMNEIWSWCDKNCEDQFDALFEHFDGNRIWIFESSEDALAFKLVWGIK
jgi:hypothetical protein